MGINTGSLVTPGDGGPGMNDAFGLEGEDELGLLKMPPRKAAPQSLRAAPGIMPWPGAKEGPPDGSPGPLTIYPPDFGSSVAISLDDSMDVQWRSLDLHQ